MQYLHSWLLSLLFISDLDIFISSGALTRIILGCNRIMFLLNYVLFLNFNYSHLGHPICLALVLMTLTYTLSSFDET